MVLTILQILKVNVGRSLCYLCQKLILYFMDYILVEACEFEFHYSSIETTFSVEILTLKWRCVGGFHVSVTISQQLGAEA